MPAIRDRGAWVERLSKSPVFAALDRASREELARLAVRRELRRGQLLWREGSTPDAIAFVLFGELHVRRGRTALLRTLRQDEVVGLSSIAGARCSADVVAGEDAAILVVSGAALRGVVGRDPTAAFAIVAHLADLVARLTDESLEERSTDLETRLLARLTRLARGRREIAMTHAELAAHVGATRANVSRALGKLAARGAVRSAGRGRIEILARQERKNT